MGSRTNSGKKHCISGCVLCRSRAQRRPASKSSSHTGNGQDNGGSRAALRGRTMFPESSKDCASPPHDLASALLPPFQGFIVFPFLTHGLRRGLHSFALCALSRHAHFPRCAVYRRALFTAVCSFPPALYKVARGRSPRLCSGRGFAGCSEGSALQHDSLQHDSLEHNSMRRFPECSQRLSPSYSMIHLIVGRVRGL